MRFIRFCIGTSLSQSVLSLKSVQYPFLPRHKTDRDVAYQDGICDMDLNNPENCFDGGDYCLEDKESDWRLPMEVQI